MDILISVPEPQRDLKLREYLESMSQDERDAVKEDIEIMGKEPRHAIQWALLQFDTLFVRATEALLKAHPVDELEEGEDGAMRPFWGGSRRLPTVARFDAGLSNHRGFVIYAAMIWGSSRGSFRNALERGNSNNVEEGVDDDDAMRWSREAMEEALEGLSLIHI